MVLGIFRLPNGKCTSPALVRLLFPPVRPSLPLSEQFPTLPAHSRPLHVRCQASALELHFTRIVSPLRVTHVPAGGCTSLQLVTAM